MREKAGERAASLTKQLLAFSCHETVTLGVASGGNSQTKREEGRRKWSCQGSSQVTDFASLASALARFGKVGREATNQKVGSSSPPGRTTSLSSLFSTTSVDTL